jgi:hypothetical protein
MLSVTNKLLMLSVIMLDVVMLNVVAPAKQLKNYPMFEAGNTKGGSTTVPSTSCLTGLESAVLQLTIFVLICKTD